MNQRLFILFPIKGVAVSLLLSLFFSVCLILAATIMYFQIQPVIPLFYSLPEASQTLVLKEWIFVFPSISVGISISHWIFLLSIKKTDPILLKLFSWTTVVLQILLALALFRILVTIT